jgi:hypothetical protein
MPANDFGELPRPAGFRAAGRYRPRGDGVAYRLNIATFNFD